VDNPEKLATEKQNKNTTQYELVTTMRKQTQITLTRHKPSYKQLEVKTNWRRVWRYQRGNQNPYKEQTTQWPKEKVQKDKQRSTKHTHNTKVRVTRTPLKTGGELRNSGRVSSSCSTSGTRRVKHSFYGKS